MTIFSNGKRGGLRGAFPMNPFLTAADLSFILCGLIVALGTLLVWAIRIADRWVGSVKIRRDRD
jgi:hypothetical protein